MLKFPFHLYITSVQSCSFTFHYCSDNMLIYISGLNSDLRSSYFEHEADFVHLSMSSPWVKGGWWVPLKIETDSCHLVGISTLLDASILLYLVTEQLL